MKRYEIAIEKQDGADIYHLKDNQRHASAVLNPALGYNLTEFRTTAAPLSGSATPTKEDAVDLFIPPDDPDLLKNTPIMAGQPILFPFPNRVRAGLYSFEGKDYSLAGLLAKGWDQGAGQAIHGLVADKPWKVLSATADENGAKVVGAIRLDEYSDIFEQYPFPCELKITYLLEDGWLQMLIDVTNLGDKTLPMGFGIHPWFPLKLRPGQKMPADLAKISRKEREQALVHVPAKTFWELENLMPTGKTLPFEGENSWLDLSSFAPLKDHFFDNVFSSVTPREDGWSEGGLRDPETGLELVVAADSQFREWVLYAPLDKHVIALEPYTCTTDAVNLQPQGINAGLIGLPAGQTWHGEIHFGLRRWKA